MVGNTGRKCSSQGINVIGGGAQCMGNIYKALLSPKSRKFDLRIQLNVPEPTLEHNMWGLVLPRRSVLALLLRSWTNRDASPTKKAPAVCRRLLVEALISRTRLEFKHSIKTDGPLMCAGVLIEWRGVVQGSV